MNGQVTLRHKSGELAAAWPFSKLMKHWKKKHAKAVYIPSITRLNPPEYQYGPKVELHQGTDFLLFLRGLSAGDVFLDPALKLETGKEGIIRIKRRNQFRIRHKNLTELYQQSELVKLNQTEPHLL